ncbi:MFS transporter [Kitasatospora sp. NPDC057965]|uniref:MFS transporter n=1 Tax=Kitasatospora sp. NPDC057965 TaxID=3346291 RepID=UPI0036DE290A
MTSTALPQDDVRRPGLTLLAICLTVVLFPLAITGASVALPSIGSDLGNSLAAGQWVVNGYDLTYAGFMLASGSIADLVGRRKVFQVGLVLFGGGALISALAPNILVLDLARAVAGIGAAAATTSGSAILAHAFDGPARARAFGLFGTSIGLGLAFGPSIAGLLTSNLGWRSVFLVPAIIGLVVLLLTPTLADSRNPAASKVDRPGTITFTLALLLLILGLVEGPQAGWSSPLVLGSFIGFVVLLVLFGVVEQRQSEPMFDLGLLKHRKFVGVSLATIPVVFGFTPLAVYLPSYFIAADGVSAQQAGLILIMLTGLTLFFPTIAGYATRWIPAQVQIAFTVILTAVGLAWLTVLEPGVGYLTLLPPLALIGIAVGLSFGLLDGAAVSSVEVSRAGMAAGMFNTVRLAGETIAIAVAGSLLVSFTQSEVSGKLGGFSSRYADDPAALANLMNQGELKSAVETVEPASQRGAFADTAASAFAQGFHGLLWVLAALCAVTFVVVALLLREPRGAVAGAPEENALPRTAEVAHAAD